KVEGEGERGEVPFAVPLGPLVAGGVPREGGVGVDQPPLLRGRPHDAEPVGALHHLDTSAAAGPSVPFSAAVAGGVGAGGGSSFGAKGSGGGGSTPSTSKFLTRLYS